MIDHAFCRKVRHLGNPAMYENTWELTERVLEEGIPGDLCEAGVYAGSHPAIMATVLQRAGVRDRKVHLFDSFQGIPKCSPRECEDDKRTKGEAPDGVLESSGVAVCSLEGVKRNMRAWGVDPSLLVYHPGWFQESLPAPGVGPLAFLRIDVDLYDSTVPVMRYLYPLVSPRGFVCSDDLGSETCRVATMRGVQAAGEDWSVWTVCLSHVDAGTHWWRTPSCT